MNEVWKGKSGSGLLLVTDGEHGLIVFNWHVVEPSPWMNQGWACSIRREGEEWVGVTCVARRGDGVDLALLLVETPGFEPLEVPCILQGDVIVGEKCVAMGNALSAGISVRDGIISRFDQIAPGMRMLRTSAPISPGNSGGPLILCRGGGWVAGVSTMSVSGDGAQNVNFAIPMDYVLNFDSWEYLGTAKQTQITKELLIRAINANSQDEGDIW